MSRARLIVALLRGPSLLLVPFLPLACVAPTETRGAPQELLGDWEVSSIAVSPDGTLLAASFADSTVRVYMTSTWQLQRTFTLEANVDGLKVRFAGPDRLVIVTTSVRAFDLATGALDWTAPIEDGLRIHALEPSPDGSRL